MVDHLFAEPQKAGHVEILAARPLRDLEDVGWVGIRADTRNLWQSFLFSSNTQFASFLPLHFPTRRTPPPVLD